MERNKNVPHWDPMNRAGKGEAEIKLQWQKVVIFRTTEPGAGMWVIL